MSERLYRGKDIHSGKWVEGYYSKTNGWNCDDTITTTYEEGAVAHFVIPKTVGQYTGFDDKEGIKIFEGDILLVSDEDGESYKTVVRFEDGAFIVDVLHADYDSTAIGWAINDHWDMYNDQYVVIGNVHDNPELLKEGAE